MRTLSWLYAFHVVSYDRGLPLRASLGELHDQSCLIRMSVREVLDKSPLPKRQLFGNHARTYTRTLSPNERKTSSNKNFLVIDMCGTARWFFHDWWDDENREPQKVMIMSRCFSIEDKYISLFLPVGALVLVILYKHWLLDRVKRLSLYLLDSVFLCFTKRCLITPLHNFDIESVR